MKPISCFPAVLNKKFKIGEVAERLKAAVLKTVVPFCGTVSSNLTLSAKYYYGILYLSVGNEIEFS